MRVVMGLEHAGVTGNEALKGRLVEAGHDVEDVGTYSAESCDYPDLAHKLASVVAAGSVDRGILVCGSGVGVAMAANRQSEVRAVQAWSEEIARLSRQHNDSNVATFGERVQSEEEIWKITEAWLATEFEGGRHVGRVAKI